MREQWLGKKGFDEAQYYYDEMDHIQSGEQNDTFLKEKVLEAFRRNFRLCHSDIIVSVHEGFVTLEGKVAGLLEKEEAADTINALSGVKVVKNLLSLED